MSHLLPALSRREEGQDLAEHALLIALVTLIILGAVRLMGAQIDSALAAFAAWVGMA